MTNGQLVMRLQAVKELTQDPDTRSDHKVAAIEAIVTQTLEDIQNDEKVSHPHRTGRLAGL